MWSEIFTCPKKNLPMNYLRIPITHKMLSVSQWTRTMEKFGKKLGLWQGGFLSLWRLTLINNSLSNIPLYMLSLFFAPLNCSQENGYFQEEAALAGL